MPSMEHEVGRLSGILEQLIQSLDDTRAEVRAITDNVQSNAIMSADLNRRLNKFDESFTKVEAQLHEILLLRSRVYGASFILIFLFGMFLKFSNGIVSFFSNLFSLLKH